MADKKPSTHKIYVLRKTAYAHRFSYEKAGKTIYRTSLSLGTNTPLVETLDGKLIDVSGFKFTLFANKVKLCKENPDFYECEETDTLKDGRPWAIQLKKEHGHWENPDAAIREERGRWITDAEEIYLVAPLELARKTYEARLALEEAAHFQDVHTKNTPLREQVCSLSAPYFQEV